MALDFVAGMFGGAAGVVVGHPFDTIKVQLQAQTANFKRYNGMFDCLSKIVKSEGVNGLYKGVSSPLAGLAFINAIVFGVYGNSLKYISEERRNDVASHTIAGAAAGFAQSFVCSPMELAKLKMQLQENSNKLSKPSTSARFGSLSSSAEVQRSGGPLEYIRQIYRSNGSKGVFKGVGLTIARDVSGFAIYFVFYESFSRWLMFRRHKDSLGVGELLMAGGLSGMVSWLLNYPIDMVKTRYQTDESRQYLNSRQCALKCYKSEGFRVFWQGLAPTLARAFPTNAVTFLTVSVVYKTYHLLRNPTSRAISPGASDLQDFECSSNVQLLTRLTEVAVNEI